MKKIEKVSIADIAFTLDSDAYLSLKKYLDSLHAYYDQDPDGSEIIADIEARIAELILDEQIYTKIVTKSLIDSIIVQLGTPEEIEELAEDSAGVPPMAEPSIPRRLYRSYEGRIFGGVCSGMAQYWDLSVAWVRLAFLSPMIIFIIAAPFRWKAVMNFMLGWSWVFIVIYIVLWMAIPIAKTARQKLEGRGEKITPSSIRQNLQDNARTPSSKKAASVVAEIVAVVGRVVLFFIKLCVGFLGFVFLVSAFGVFVGMIAAMVNPASVIIITESSLAGLSMLTPVGFLVLCMFCTMIPLFVLGLALLSLIFRWKPGKIFYGVVVGLWLLGVIFLSVVLVRNARYLRNEFRDGSVSIGWNNEYNGRKAIIRIEDDDDADDEDERWEINVAGDSVVVIVGKHGNTDTLSVGEFRGSRGDDERIEIRRIKE